MYMSVYVRVCACVRSLCVVSTCIVSSYKCNLDTGILLLLSLECCGTNMAISTYSKTYHSEQLTRTISILQVRLF